MQKSTTNPLWNKSTCCFHLIWKNPPKRFSPNAKVLVRFFLLFRMRIYFNSIEIIQLWTFLQLKNTRICAKLLFILPNACTNRILKFSYFLEYIPKLYWYVNKSFQIQNAFSYWIHLTFLWLTFDNAKYILCQYLQF